MKQLFLFLQLLWLVPAKGQDPFKAYLSSVPEIATVISDTLTGEGAEAIVTRKITFRSRNGANRVYAVMAFPRTEGKYPGMLFLHGGGSRAEDMLDRVQEYARRGYVALAPDLPGICGNGKTPYSTGAWKSRPGGEAPRFDLTNGPESSTLTDAIVAGLEAFNLLRCRPDVDVSHMGITGFSWGGYSTTMLSGLLGNKVQAAYSVFGSGYYELGSFWKEIIARLPEADRKAWLQYFDAGRRAQHIKAPFFMEAASNDTFFWPEAVMATLGRIKGTKNLVWGPNINHKQIPGGSKMQELYFDYYLKGKGQPFGRVEAARKSPENVEIVVHMPQGIRADSVMLYYSEPSASWQDRNWIAVPAEKTGEKFNAVIPAAVAGKEIYFFGYARDSRGVALASLMYGPGLKQE
ncbi:alpha/beta hydrolase family protein [Chitinophaga barathri]|uniref:Dienelactone hydrolase domain-containing protein n=1 Tax=Chitinophaga barathri TaxID=1647451 RepID=A0A3N4M6C0_9BACT|nr:alpha/beta fold hydrolase [Chitinophaga barathri]RPD38698.1 hypothetical protein EG028_23610 [Chitinophaga barathri]